MKKGTALLLGISILTALISLIAGRYPLGIRKIAEIISGNSQNRMDVTLFYQVRLPRMLYVFLAGGMLSQAGLIYQAIFKNPLVAPDILGVSSGCSIGAILAILLPRVFLYSASILPFLCGILTVIFASFTARLFYGDVRVRMVLAGIITGSLANSVIMILKYTADPNRELPAMEYWLMGTFQNSGWDDIVKLLPFFFAVEVLLLAIRFKMNVFGLEEEEAMALGVNVKRLRIFSIAAATLLVAAVVSKAGIVAWIGLISPHIAKLIAGPLFSDSYFPSFITGSILLTVSDLLARSMFSAELPISILTSFLGALILFGILIKKKRGCR